MNQHEAKNYIQDIAHIWTNGLCDQLEKYYAKDFKGNYYGNLINFDDLIQRLNYMNLHQSQRNLSLQDIIVDDLKIAVRFHYSAVDDIEGPIASEMVAIYHLNEDKKIIQAWAFSDQPVKYTR